MISYGAASHYPQVAVLHRRDSYFRLTAGLGGGWGTSVILLPVVWTTAGLQQGAPVRATWATAAGTLRLQVRGTIAGLRVQLSLTLHPPTASQLVVDVAATATGTLPLAPRPDEAFKLVTLSSMRCNDEQWDCQAAVIDTLTVALPAAGAIVRPARRSRGFGLRGGSSSWKRTAPSIEIALSQRRPVTGWVSPSDDPNDDNVALWAAAASVLSGWHYTIRARRAL